MRLFVGINPPRFIKEGLGEVQEEHRHGINWTPAGNLHITLKFIGEWHDASVENVISTLYEISSKPFLLPVEGVGAFPPPPRKVPHVVWVGLGGAHPHLFGLQRKVDQSLYSLGIEMDTRVYRPHITVGRCRSNARESVRQWLKAREAFQLPPFKVDYFTLFSSVPSLRGRKYQPLHSFPLED